MPSDLACPDDDGIVRTTRRKALAIVRVRNTVHRVLCVCVCACLGLHGTDCALGCVNRHAWQAWLACGLASVRVGVIRVVHGIRTIHNFCLALNGHGNSAHVHVLVLSPKACLRTLWPLSAC